MSAPKVPVFSGRVRAELANCIERCYSHSEISVLYTRFDIDETDGGNKLQRSTTLIRALHETVEGDGVRVLDLIRSVVEDRFGGDVLDRNGNPNPNLRPLIAALRVDGYELLDGRLVAAGAGSIPMTAEVSLLESRLRERQLAVAARHYRQAVDSFTDGRLEASNGQLRSCLKNVLIELGARHGRRTSDPKGAAELLRTAGLLDGDETKLLQGLIGVSNERGAHHGTTTEEEATFRLHTTTAVLRYLLARVRYPA
jgi:hypothetical protein